MREIVLSSFLSGFSSASSSLFRAFADESPLLERYTDSEEGFTLLKPSSWVKVDKAGATVLFEEPNKGRSNNVGVVVSLVRLTSLEEFGSAEFVADKLIQAEKRKESTKDAEVIGFGERSGKGGLEVYEIEYGVDSSRGGMKRVFSATFINSRKLYLLNITHSDKQESPLHARTRTVLEQVLHSFDAARIAHQHRENEDERLFGRIRIIYVNPLDLNGPRPDSFHLGKSIHLSLYPTFQQIPTHHTFRPHQVAEEMNLSSEYNSVRKEHNVMTRFDTWPTDLKARCS